MAMKDQHHVPFRGLFFKPSDKLLVNHFLRRRIVDGSTSVPDYLIKEFDVYSTEPWNLPCNSFQYLNYDEEMHFFTPRRPTSHKSKTAGRTAGTGFWDGNAKLTPINIDSNVVGHKTSLNFKILKGGKKIKTEWIMHEFRLSRSSSITTFDDLVLCRIHEKKKKKKKKKNDDGHALILPSSPSSVAWLTMPAVQSEEGWNAPSASPSNDTTFLEEAPLAADEGLNLEKAPVVADERSTLANMDWDETLLLLENFASDLTSKALLSL